MLIEHENLWIGGCGPKNVINPKFWSHHSVPKANERCIVVRHHAEGVDFAPLQTYQGPKGPNNVEVVFLDCMPGREHEDVRVHAITDGKAKYVCKWCHHEVIKDE